MRGKGRAALYVALSVAVIAAGAFALDRGARARAAESTLAEGVQMRVLETGEHLAAIEGKLQKLLVATTAGKRAELLSETAVSAAGAGANLAALPLSHPATADTVKFLHQTGDFAQSLVARQAEGEGFSQAEEKTIAALAAQCARLAARWREVGDDIAASAASGAGYYAGGGASGAGGNASGANSAGNVGGADGANSGGAGNSNTADAAPDSTLIADSGMDYPTMIYDGAFSDARHLGIPRGLPAGEITQEQAFAAARAFVGEERVLGMALGAETQGAIPTFGVEVALADGTLTLEITKQGGKPLWMVPEHAAFSPLLSLDECERKALAFLESRGFPAMECNHWQVYDGLAVLNFVPLQDGVLLYPDLLKLQLRMDMGEVVGLEANNYWMNHRARELPVPALTQAEASARAAEKLTVTRTRLCLIPYRNSEAVCWEVSGTRDGEEYRVYLDAQTGAEKEVLKILRTGGGEFGA